MHDRLCSISVACAALCGLLLAWPAAPLTAQTLYRVELMVFSSPAGGGSEQWEALPQLIYPASTRFLIDPRDQYSTMPQLGDTGHSPTAGVAPGSQSPPAAPPVTAGYLLLPAQERELAAGAASMRGSGQYRILFHESWLQPMPVKSAATPVVLDRSGEGGAWPELQGTVTLYQAGDFTVETNLWLNTAGEYLPGTWRMPSPPRGPRPERDASQLDSALPATQSSGVSSESPADSIGEYPYRHAVLLRQSRRTQGGEVFYIDHPLLGVVGKISPIELPEAVPDADGAIPASSVTTP